MKTKESTIATRAIGYIRVSTAKQSEEGVSLEVQEKQLKNYAELYTITLVGIETDEGISAKTLERDGLTRALRRLLAGEANALLISKLDRLTRSVKDLGLLLEKYFMSDKYALLSVGDQIDTRSAAGRLTLNVLTSVAQWEREVISERTTAAMRHKIELGEYTGGYVPYGFKRKGKVLVADEAEQKIIHFACRLRNEGRSMEQIAKELMRRHIVTRNKKDFWHAAQVSRLLTREQKENS
jgi:site-specific DNA recombinase